MDDTDLYDALSPPPSQAAALAAALRGARTSAALWSGAPHLAGIGKGLNEAADSVAPDANAVEHVRQMGLAQDPNSFASQATRQLAGQMGLQPPEGTSAADLGSVLPEAVKAYGMRNLANYRGEQLNLGQQRVDQGNARLAQAEKALAQRGVRYNSNTGEFENVSSIAGGGGRHPTPPTTSPAPPQAASDAPGDPASPTPAPHVQPMGGKMLQQALEKLGNDMNASAGRAGEFGKNQARINAANRFLQLAQTPDGKAADLNPQQMAEAVQSLVSLISSGGQGAQSQIEHMLPKSYSRDAAGIMQYLTSEPHGAGQQAFVQNMIDTAKREQGVAQGALDQVRQALGPKHQVLFQRNPGEANNVLKPYGLQIGPNGSVVPIAQSAAASPGKATHRYNPATGKIEAIGG